VTISCTAATSNANWQESNDSTITTKVGISSLLANQKIHVSDTSELDVPNHPGLNPVRTLSQGNQLANLFSYYSLLSTRASSGGIASNHVNSWYSTFIQGWWCSFFSKIGAHISMQWVCVVHDVILNTINPRKIGIKFLIPRGGREILRGGCTLFWKFKRRCVYNVYNCKRHLLLHKLLYICKQLQTPSTFVFWQ